MSVFSFCRAVLIVLACTLVSGCIARNTEPNLEETRLLASRQLVREAKGVLPQAAGVQSLPPSRLLALFSERLASQGSAKIVSEYARQRHWFLEPGLISITECEHCRSQSVNIVSSEYGRRRDPRRRGVRFHEGIDIRAPLGSGALAFKGGEVIRANRFSGYGLTVEILQYDGFVARYAHLNRIMVQQGQVVSAGQQIGQVGRTGRTTGSHLHFELIREGESLDPQLFLTRVEQVMRCLKTGK